MYNIYIYIYYISINIASIFGIDAEATYSAL